MKVLVTDGNLKHAQAFLRGARSAHPDIMLTSHVGSGALLDRPCRRYVDEVVTGMPLADVLRNSAFDLVVPVSGQSVRAVAATCLKKAVLPSLDTIEHAFDKPRITATVADLGIPVPISEVTQISRLSHLSETMFPLVLKSGDETAGKFVFYCASRSELVEAGAKISRLGFGERLLIAQRRIIGPGFGVSMLYNRGSRLMHFAHERIREYPASGGASSAARSIRNDLLEQYAQAIGDKLGWHGLLMCEFKFDQASNTFYFIETNPKVWGSLALPIACGVNFAGALIALQRGGRVTQPAYPEGLEYVWPLDGDLETILRLRDFQGLRRYLTRNCHNDLGYCPAQDVVGLARFLYRVLSGRYRSDSR